MEKKYLPLATFFTNIQDDTISLTYSEIENIMGHQLPNTAYLNSSWWKKEKLPFTHYEAWKNAGYKVSTINVGVSITFMKDSLHASSLIIKVTSLFEKPNQLIRNNIYN